MNRKHRRTDVESMLWHTLSESPSSRVGNGEKNRKVENKWNRLAESAVIAVARPYSCSQSPTNDWEVENYISEVRVGMFSQTHHPNERRLRQASFRATGPEIRAFRCEA